MPARVLYRLYSIFYRFSIWRKHHVSTAGATVPAAFFMSILLGINIYRTNLYMVTALTGCIIATSFLLNLFRFRCRVSVTRHLPECITAGSRATYELEIVNHSGSDQKGLVLYENVFDPRPSFQEFLSTKEPFEDRRNIWDRKILYYRWLWQIKKNKNANLKPIFLPDLPLGKPVRVRIDIYPFFRGYVRFSGVTLARPDIIGLFRRRIQAECPGKLLVLPQQRPVRLPDPVSRRQYQPGGIQLASSIGNSDEFIGLRNYRPGDPLRNIHWKSFAKTGELVIREFEDEFFQRNALILDTGAGPDDNGIFEEAVSIAAYCVYEIETRDSVLDLMFAGDKVFSFTSGRGLGGSEKMLEILACIEPVPDGEILQIVTLLKQNIRQFSGVVCIFLNWAAGHRKVFDLLEGAGLAFHMIVLTDDRKKTIKEILAHTGSMERIHVEEWTGGREEVSKR